MSSDSIVIVGSARTPIGAFQGELQSLSASNLGSHAVRAALQRAKVEAETVDEVLMGCVLPAGLGQAPARQAAIGAGVPPSVPCTTLNKVCGSGMKTVMLGHDLIRAGSAAVVVSGGMESMSNAPYLMAKARGGYRLGHAQLLDHMFLDGLEDAYDKGRLMGSFAEDTAQHYQFTRDQQDGFALSSLERARCAAAEGRFEAEIEPLEVAGVTVASDEQPRRARPEKIPTLRPAFRPDGTVTAANASSISDGAAALVLMTEREAERRRLTPLARIVGHAGHAQAPAWFTTAPVAAIEKLLKRVGWSVDEVDLFEINEAFAVVVLAAERELGLDRERVNVNGGACALGHPIGCSGTRILVTLLGALEDRDLKRGVASLCIGGGEATAVALERF